jgi:Ca2+-binding RTX toxin-like protein
VISDFANTQVTFSGVERIDIRLGSGNDNVATGAGDDSISGGAGNDTLNSGAGAAVIDGGDGTDQWAADFSADATAKTIDLSLAGVQNAGNGSTYVNVERLNILGGAGNDRFETRTDNANDGLADFLDGGLGNDTLVVGGGIDTVVGGDGDDLLVVDWSTDATGFSNLSATVISDFANTQVTFSGVERIDIRLGSGNDNVATGAGDDSISGGAGNDTLNSGLGRADVRGGDGTDLWVADYSNTGNARSVDLNLTGRQAAGNLNFYEGIERLNITGGGGNDFLFSRIGSPNDGLNDTMNGGNGNDTLGVGGGVDVVDGGIGDDVLFIDWSTDANSFSNSGATVISDFANTQVSFSNIERLDIRLGVGADNVTTGAGNDTVRGGGGNDTLNGGDGIDILDLSDAAGAVTVSFTSATAGTAAGVGADSFQNFERIDLGSFNDTVNGGAGAVEANGNGGRDRMFGGGGNDTLNGGGGGDRLFGDAGQDVMTGGSGNDRFVFRSKSDSGRTEATADTITDFTPGGADQIDLSGIIANDLSPADPFVWMGTDAFTGIGQARYYVSSGNTYVAINTFGNTSPEMLIRLDGEVVLNAADFLL